MIPKIIHYCWMSGEEYPDLVKKCIDSWKRVLPDYEIKEWNSINFDYKQNRYCYEAYKRKKWAFVSDYIRLKVLYEQGGIYLDSDIEVFKKFDDLLTNKAFTGFETNEIIGPWLLASEAKNPMIEEFLSAYKSRPFVKEDNSLDLTPNPVILSAVLTKHGFIKNGKIQTLNNFTIYPKEYFCPKDFTTGTVELSTKNYCIHYFNGGWLPISSRIKNKVIRILYKVLGEKNGKKVNGLYKKIKETLN